MDQIVYLRDVEVLRSPIAWVGGNVYLAVGTAVGVLNVARVRNEALPAEVVAAAPACEH